MFASSTNENETKHSKEIVADKAINEDIPMFILKEVNGEPTTNQRDEPGDQTTNQRKAPGDQPTVIPLETVPETDVQEANNEDFHTESISAQIEKLGKFIGTFEDTNSEAVQSAINTIGSKDDGFGFKVGNPSLPGF